jgi:hypothetical protein
LTCRYCHTKHLDVVMRTICEDECEMKIREGEM